MDRAPPGEGLPASQDDIDISRADLEATTNATGHFGRDQARAGTEKRVIDQLARSAVAIVRQPVTRPPRLPSWEAFGRRPSARADRSPPAGIRNPSP